MAVYRAEHGDWPESLEQLLPEILQTVPPDPWSDGPLKYRREGDGFVLYSIGDDLEDDGGVEYEQYYDEGDVVVTNLEPDGEKIDLGADDEE
ncbi:MAG: hypothetical protein GVY16_02460 [Planctomycetes bacterium]|nr:hypothetical protein [Planctomycetota bacterium]